MPPKKIVKKQPPIKKYKPPTPTRGPGNPTKYTPGMCNRLPEMFSEGQDVSVILVELGIARSTFYKWIKKYPEFKEAYEMGREHSKAYCTEIGWDLVHGKIKKGNTAAWIFMMKNKFNWQDKVEVDTASDRVTIEEMISETTATPKEAEKAYFTLLKNL